MTQLDSATQKRTLRSTSLAQEALDWFQGHCAKIAPLSETQVTCWNPSTGTKLWTIPDCSNAHVDQAVANARAALPKWSATLPAERAKYLLACADVIDANKDEIAHVLALETGKSLFKECNGEAVLPGSIFRYFAGLVHEIKGRTIQAGPDLMGFTTRHPWGVVAGIVPWNVPLMFMAYKVAAPLAAGNCVVIKMPEQATASLSMILKLILPLLPEGVVDFISGTGAKAGVALSNHDDVDKISFTGSVETGSLIYQNAARKMKAVTLELGGKSPMIILEDCDHAKAINGIIGSMRFTRSGQSCTAASRIYVPKEQFDTYRTALADALNNLCIGDAMDEGTDAGPVVSLAQKQSIDAYLGQAKSDGLDVVEYGMLSVNAANSDGFFIKPHVVYAPDHTHPIAMEEVFGPVATLTGYTSLEEAMTLANDTKFGLSASVWGRDINQCLKCAAGFRAGIVQINQNAIMLPGFSYGGVGISGVGKESSLEAMLETYMYEKTNIVNFGD